MFSFLLLFNNMYIYDKYIICYDIQWKFTCKNTCTTPFDKARIYNYPQILDNNNN